MSPRTGTRNTTSMPTLSPKMDSLAVPRPRPSPHSRQFSSGTAASLRLPSLPRFHPANFPSSQNSSTAATPATGPNSPQPPVSPRGAQQQYAEAQRQMLMYQAQFGRQNRGNANKPTSPKLCPLGSPGPVTPLELEGADGYLTAGANINDAAKHVDKLIREEARRRGEISPGRTTAVGGR